MKKLFFTCITYMGLCFSIFTTSCSEDSERGNLLSHSSFPLTVQANSLEITSIRLFSDGNEIKDSQIINNYIQKSKDYFYFNTDNNKPFSGEILFLSKDTATVNNRKFSINKIDEHIYTLYSKRESLNDYNNGFTLSDIIKYKSPQSPAAGGKFVSREVMVIHSYEDRIEISALSYDLRLHSNSSYSYNAGRIYNEFNENILKLTATDTLAIQECRLIYIPK
ncbi:MAG: hypothetical protein ACK5KT_05615 [Dysgonomonas sp.]